jgi:hypothetical protein
MKSLTPYLLSVLRIVAAFVYVAHGTQKLFGFPGHPFHAPVLAATMMGAAGMIETIGGIVHQAGGVLHLGADGGRLFHAARAEGVLADHDRRRARGAVLLPLAFLLRRRPRTDQRRRAARKIMTRSDGTAETAKDAKILVSAFIAVSAVSSLYVIANAPGSGEHRPNASAARRSVTQRLASIDDRGPTSYAFTFTSVFPPVSTLQRPL